MATELLMPALSPTMEEGTLGKWLVKEGDTVSAGDLLAEIETDKATMELEAVDDGVMGPILVPEGTEGVKINTPIAIILEEGEDADAVPAPAAQPPEAAAAPESGSTAETPAPAPASTAPAPSAAGAAAAPQAVDGARIFASPLARRIAAEKGIDLASVTGSGPNGRIVKTDVEAAQPGTAAQLAAAAPSVAPAPAPLGETSPDEVRKLFEGRRFEEIPLDSMRRTIAQRLAVGKQVTPHFYLRRSARIDRLLELRKEINASLEKSNIKLSVNDFVIKASALALQEFPAANAVWAGDRLLQMKASDIGIAVAIDGGLFVPVLRDLETKPLSAISREMREIGAKAKRKRLMPEDYQGGSFAISNLGMYGVENFDAVINPPHAAILAVGAGLRKPVVDGDSIGIATVMSLTISCDHRVMDGALGAEVLGAIVAHLENPAGMLA